MSDYTSRDRNRAASSMDLQVEHAERLMRLETQLSQISEDIKKYVEADLAAHNELCDKVDGLLALKEKGMGALWLASAILGTGLLGIAYACINWLKS